MVKPKAFGTTFHEGETDRFGFPEVGMEIKEFRAGGSSTPNTTYPTLDWTSLNMYQISLKSLMMWSSTWNSLLFRSSVGNR